MDVRTVVKMLLLIAVLPYHCAPQEMHSAIPSSCPTNRTRVIQQQGRTVIGEINTRLVEKIFATGQNLTALSEYYINSGGIYLLPEPVRFNARIMAVKAFGFYDEAIGVTSDPGSFLPAPRIETMSNPQIFLYTVVYRPSNNGSIYSLMHDPTQLDHGFTPGRLPVTTGEALDWNVQEGDRIGVYIPWQCFNTSDDRRMCPSQVNLETSECRSALYHHGRDGVDNLPVDEFKEVQVWLNMEAILLSPDENTVLVVALVVVLTIVVFCFVLLVVVLVCKCYLHKRATKQDSLSLHHGHMAINQALGSSLKKGDLEDVFPVVSNEKRASYCYISDVPPATGVENKDGYMLVTLENMDQTPQDRGSKLFNNYVLSSGSDKGYDYDYEVPYFEPANQEEELVMQLNTKLAVTEIPRDELELCEILGSGAFGTVYRGVWSHMTKKGEKEHEVKEEVAVKTVDGEVSEMDRIKFLQEATIMAQFKHPTIIFLKGVLLKNQMMIVLDLMEGGDLRKYLLTTMRERLGTLDSSELASHLLSFMRQIAQGMIYLQFKSYVHRDLAARNVLVSKDGLICKISDFGLSRDLQHENYYISHGGKIPVKWTAPEALKYHKYSTASDIWSYGCVLYEIWSLGEKPFQDMTNQEAMTHVMAGNRLPPPPGCPRAVYTTMIQCWHPDADQRPCFGLIVQQLQKPDFHILKWSADDANAYSQEAQKLGAPLHHGKELFKALQRTYLNNNR